MALETKGGLISVCAGSGGGGEKLGISCSILSISVRAGPLSQAGGRMLARL